MRRFFSYIYCHVRIIAAASTSQDIGSERRSDNTDGR